MHRILVLRSGGAGLPAEAKGSDVTLLSTHEIVPVPSGIAEALAFDARGARLVVSSKVTVEVLGTGFFEREFKEIIAVGEETARAIRNAWGTSAVDVVVPPIPGASGVLHLLRRSPGGLSDLRIFWPRGSDADTGPLEELSSLGASVVAPVVYDKHVRLLQSFSSGEREILSAFSTGGFGAVAVGSIAALDGFLQALGGPAPAALPPVRWGVLGPETARAFVARGFPSPAVPQRARFADLIQQLRREMEIPTP
jgi:uroporphyrinogen-III synthase